MMNGRSGRTHYRISGVHLSCDRSLQTEFCNGPAAIRGWRISERLPAGRYARSWRRRGFCSRPLPGGAWFVVWPGEGAFWIHPRSRRVEYAVNPGLSPEDFSDMVLGPVVSYLLLFDGVDPLHGSAVRIGDAAVCFLGASGSGKSTLAASLLMSGSSLIVDDVLAVVRKGGIHLAHPGYPEIRLWPSVGRKVVAGFNNLPRVVPGATKRRLDPRVHGGGFEREPVPIRVIYEIRRSRTLSRPEITALTGREAFVALLRNIYNISQPTEDAPFRQFLAVKGISSEIPVRRLTLPRFVKDPLALAGLIVNDMAEIHGTRLERAV